MSPKPDVSLERKQQRLGLAVAGFLSGVPPLAGSLARKAKSVGHLASKSLLLVQSLLTSTEPLALKVSQQANGPCKTSG